MPPLGCSAARTRDRSRTAHADVDRPGARATARAANAPDSGCAGTRAHRQHGLGIRGSSYARDQMKRRRLPAVRCAASAPSHSRAALVHDRVEHRLEVGRRARDDPQDLAVAVCCSSDSVSSRFRASSSLNSRTFSIAMTAWSAKVSRSLICLSVKDRTSSPIVMRIAPIGVALAQQRHCEDGPDSPACADARRSSGLRIVARCPDVDDRAVEDRSAGHVASTAERIGKRSDRLGRLGRDAMLRHRRGSASHRTGTTLPWSRLAQAGCVLRPRRP